MPLFYKNITIYYYIKLQYSLVIKELSTLTYCNELMRFIQTGAPEILTIMQCV